MDVEPQFNGNTIDAEYNRAAEIARQQRERENNTRQREEAERKPKTIR